MTSVPFSVRLDAETRARLAEEARRVERPASQVAQRAIERYLASQDAFRRMVEEAVEEAKAGVFISSEAMNAWVDSWGTETELPPPEPDIFPDDR